MTTIAAESLANLTPTAYENLMTLRIRKILLISSSYDAYTLEEDGRIEVQINKEYTDLNLSNPPSFVKASSASEALKALEADQDIDLIISLYNVGEMDVFSFSKLVREKYDIPFVLLTSFSKDIFRRIELEDRSAIDYTFCWSGNTDLIIAIIKTIEDRMNADNDILGVGVQSILLVEDSIRYYSTYLPAIYKLVLQQSSEFLREALNEQQQMLSKRARPKILFATNYTEAIELYQKYKHNMLGVISDVGFVINKEDRSEDEKLDAGIDLCRLIKADAPHMPFLLQSSQESIREVAKELGVGFIAKYSKTLLLQLSDYISEEFAFGDFVFKDLQTGEIIARASNLKDMQKCVAEIPEEVLLYNTSRNRLSKWMFSRGLFKLARIIKAGDKEDFASTEELRSFIIGAIKEYRIIIGQGVVARFDPDTYNQYIWFARLGEGSLGGKARGLAFMNSMLQKYKLYDKYEDVKILLPRTIVVATDYFDEFIRENGLQYVINSDISDEEILSEFVSSRLPERLVDKLRAYIKYARGPLAIRSSSKLEDSHYQPFAGIYSTYMIPMTDNPDQTLRLVGKAIKSVYASVYFASSRAYILASANLLSEEKMGVIIQEICGTEDHGYFFPTISGVARSMNCYPIGEEKPEDGVANIAAGLGKLVVDGGQCLRFSPKYPKNVLQLSDPMLALRDTQREMYVLDLKPEEFKTSIDDAVNLRKFEINKATHFRNMKHVSSTWDAQNQTISDSTFDEGRKIITFSRILKYDSIPLAEIISELLDICKEEMKCNVEIEFAVNMDVPPESDSIFNFLQIRPIIDYSDKSTLDWDNMDLSDALIYSDSALGTGETEGVCDIVYVKQDDFNAANTLKISEEIAALNSRMHEECREYILVGPGRWGSSDPWLGIPVKWANISEAKVIVECGIEELHVEPSQGTHFFQNLTSFGVGYMTISPFMGRGIFDIAALDKMDAVYETEFIRQVRMPKPFYIYIDGRKSKGVVKMAEE